MAISKRYFGLTGSAKAWLATDQYLDSNFYLILCKNSKEIDQMSRDIKFFAGENIPIFPFMPLDTLPFEFISAQTDILAHRMKVLHSIANNDGGIIISCPDAIMQKIISPATFNSLSFRLDLDSQVSRPLLQNKLLSAGYRFVTIVEEVGEVAIRGNILDIFTPLYSEPIRFEFIGDKIESIRIFDPETQRSKKSISSALVIPIREFSGYISNSDEINFEHSVNSLRDLAKKSEVPPSELEAVITALEEGTFLPGIEQFIGHIYNDACLLFDYFKSEPTLIINSQINFENEVDNFSDIINERFNRFKSEHRLTATPDSLYITPSELLSKINNYKTILLEDIETLADENLAQNNIRISVLQHSELQTKLKAKAGSGEALLPLIEQITEWRNNNYHVAFVTGSSGRANRLQKILLEYEILPEVISLSGLDWIATKDAHPLVILNGELEEGFRLPKEKIVFIAETEVFSERSIRNPPTKVRSLKKFMSALAQLKDGDFIVHLDYGVGLYHGLIHLVVDGKGRDFLHIEYAGGTKLYLPVEHIGKVQKFVSKEGVKPILDKLGSKKWEQKKAKVKQALVTLAGELIKLYASRSNLRGWRFEPPGAEDERFADGFGFEETPDQLRAIEETLADMASERPMDRLICGDAGFGKTEVALRAAFKCIQHGRQVAVLVPTTILAEQHYNVFRERFMEYPVNVGITSRFYNNKKNAETLSSLAKGKLDIIIGTHKLLQPAVEFKDLGLLIIDEEHRFGVKHKEKLKQIKKNVDVLTLTATPIPRTLHMALLGIRSISIITTPPHDRRVIRTYVATYEPFLIRDAVLREMQRGGQIFVLHNKVQNIATFTNQLKDLIPEAKMDFAHGQMHESELEKVMLKFVLKEIDVLICTTIIESGLDIPNANTIILTRADQLGLAQLYQLRGRVGRSNKQAYAYMLVPELKKLGDDAKKRLQVLQSLDDLGVGFNLAARDLEIRGAGNLLGKDQSGNVLSVGLELYNKILKEAILNLRGEEIDLAETIDPEMRLSVDAYLPPEYVPDISERLILYQRLADLADEQAGWELYYEIEDRFGQLPLPAQHLIELMRLRTQLRINGITRIDANPGEVKLTFSPRVAMNLNRIAELINSYPDQYSIKGKQTVVIKNPSINPDTPASIIAILGEFLQK